MSNNVFQFTGTQVRQTQNPEDNGFLIGYAAAIADIWRNDGTNHAEEVLNGSGITLEEFKQAGVEEYDLDALEEIYELI